MIKHRELTGLWLWTLKMTPLLRWGSMLDKTINHMFTQIQTKVILNLSISISLFILMASDNEVSKMTCCVVLIMCYTSRSQNSLKLVLLI